MSDLRTAAQQALEALETNNQAWKHLADSGDAGFLEAEEQPFYETSVKAITALRAALAEPVQEPVAYSVARTLHWHEGKGVNDAQLYLAPHQRKPLTEEEIDALDLPPSGTATVRDLVRLIERAHGIV